MLSVTADIASIVGAALAGLTVYLLLIARRRPLRIDRGADRVWIISSQRDGGTIVVDKLINKTDSQINRYHGEGLTSPINANQSVTLAIVLGPGEHAAIELLPNGENFEMFARPQNRFTRRRFDLIVLPNVGKM